MICNRDKSASLTEHTQLHFRNFISSDFSRLFCVRCFKPRCRNTVLYMLFFFVVLKTLTFPFLAPIRGLKSDDTNSDVEWWENVRKVEADSTGVSKSLSVHVSYFRSLSLFTFSDSKTGNWMCRTLQQHPPCNSQLLQQVTTAGAEVS